MGSASGLQARVGLAERKERPHTPTPGWWQAAETPSVGTGGAKGAVWEDAWPETQIPLPNLPCSQRNLSETPLGQLLTTRMMPNRSLV